MYGTFKNLEGQIVYVPDSEEKMRHVEFKPYATMFKLTEVDSYLVACVACGQPYQLSDLVTDMELNDDYCPACGTHAAVFWKGKPHRKVCCNAEG